MDTRYNILYFPNGYDIRLCPKNATVSLKTAYNLCNKADGLNSDGRPKQHMDGVSESYRKDVVLSKGYWQNYPFRKTSIRIAVKRDPVKRFLSACNYYIRQQTRYLNKDYDQKWYDSNHPKNKESPVYDYDLIVSKTVREMIVKLEAGQIKDTHFYSQTHYLGHPDDYDIVYDINDLQDLFDLLNNKCNPKTEIPYLRRNNSDSYKSYNDTLTHLDIELIKEFYDKDYRRGWYTETSI